MTSVHAPSGPPALPAAPLGSLAPVARPRIAPRGHRPQLDDIQRVALEAFADTVIPGRKRYEGDDAICGVSDTPGAVETGALEVLTDPATGIEDGVGEMAHLLNARALAWSTKNHPEPVQRFADLGYTDRRRLLGELTGPDEAQRDLWFILALFSTMAFDSAPHRETAEAVADPTSGVYAIGFKPPVPGDRWRFDDFSYGRQALARLAPGTDPRTGSLR